MTCQRGNWMRVALIRSLVKIEIIRIICHIYFPIVRNIISFSC